MMNDTDIARMKFEGLRVVPQETKDRAIQLAKQATAAVEQSFAATEFAEFERITREADAANDRLMDITEEIDRIVFDHAMKRAEEKP